MNDVSRAPAPLRPGDPRTLGPYEIVGRLGRGGMGTVYLAHGPQGVPVAVKVIRADLAPDEEFRRRFRSEVNRVRQVPPFCTAEVLDADPDHEHPYLVVEYVDGPTLADVVRQRGPLTASNLHGVAIGVATALTAIHGAGVIHRDLKPANVLLALGSPKVIDFGIARALEATSQHTGADQLVGTVPYMAPERFGSQPGVTLSPASDIFAWGSVVAYAGVGRTPFGADSPTATAGRILTQPPELSGLTGALRSLVAHSLEKDPANRPTARELLDLLLSSGSQRSAATVAALAHQPGLRAAAREAQAATDVAAAHDVMADAVPAAPVTAVAPGERAGGDSGTASGPAGPDDDLTGLVGAGSATSLLAAPTAVGARRIPRQVSSAPVGSAPMSPAAPAAAAPQEPDRRRWWLFLGGVLALLTVLAVLERTSVVIGYPLKLGGPAVDTFDSPDGALLFTDDLTRQRLWKATSDAHEGASCTFADALVVRRQKAGTFRCRGPLDVQPADQRVEVGVRLLSPDSCASLWLRFREYRGYQVRVCDTTVYVGIHRRDSAPQVYKTFPLDRPIGIGAPSTRIAASVVGEDVEVSRDGEVLGTVRLPAPDIDGGRVHLGIFTEPQGPGRVQPYEVAFDHVSVFSVHG